MYIKKPIYTRFYNIFQNVFMDREFPDQNIWKQICRNKTSEKHWEQARSGTLRPVATLLSGKEWRYFSRFKSDYNLYKLSSKDMPDDVVIKTMKWLGVVLPEKYIKENRLSDKVVAEVLFQFFWEHYDPDFLATHTELFVFDTAKGFVNNSPNFSENDFLNVYSDGKTSDTFVVNDDQQRVREVLREFFLYSHFGINRITDILTQKFKRNIQLETIGMPGGYYKYFGPMFLYKEIEVDVKYSADGDTAKFICLIRQSLSLTLNEKIKKLLECEVRNTDLIAELTYRLNGYLKDKNHDAISCMPIYKLINASNIIEFILYNSLSEEEIDVIFSRTEPYFVYRILHIDLIYINKDWKIDNLNSAKLDEVRY
jgi:hypothetical protein